ncbi:MAG: hypothetical protein IH621_14830, partial [Krumholzibacteria bacterium]|nr:hypothetical protein [Candidatus Krumholzibacteria bacterium]
AQTINRAGGDLLLIIDDILDMTRVESGRLDLHFERLDPRGLAADLEDLFRPVAGRRGLELRVEVAPELPAILVSDPLRLSQILKNLLNNAVKFTERGSVTFTVRPAAPRERPAGPAAGDWVAFSVADTGIGMDPGTAARVCEPFFQGDGSIGRRYGGSGLGLSICARLTDLLGGRLDVESTPGRGSTFVLVLPVTAPGAPRGLPVREAPAADPLIPWEGRLAGRTVLLVDGDMRTVYSLSHVLDRMQARVRIARSVAEALDQAAQEPGPDLLCVSPGLFADRPGALRQLFAGPGDRPRPCLWLGAAPADQPWLPDRTATAPMPLDPLRTAEACTRLCALDLQPA